MAKTTGKRTVMILFRVTQNEYEVIKKNSAASGMSMSEFIRKTLMGKKIVSAPPADFPFLIREIKRVGNNLNQVLRKLNILGIAHSLDLEQCQTEIVEIEKLLYRTFRPGKGDD